MFVLVLLHFTVLNNGSGLKLTDAPLCCDMDCFCLRLRDILIAITYTKKYNLKIISLILVDF